jgi:DNA-binding NarL/FixJ family response regulator
VTTSLSSIRVILVDDHKLLLELLADSIGLIPGFSVVARCTSSLEAIEAAQTTACDVVVLDLMMPGIDGLECVRSLRRADPSKKILIVSGNTHPLSLSRALQLDVRGYVEKSADTEEILLAIRTVAAGKTYFGQSLQTTVRKLRASPFPFDAAQRLSSRERTVLAGIAAGGTSKSIAAQLALSEFTIKNHRRRIKSKTGLQTNAELILHATKLGLHQTATL